MEFFQKMWNPLGLPIPSMPGMPGAPGAGAQSGAFNAMPQMPPFMPFPPQMNAAMNPFASFDPAEVERKIGEFKAVEGWLSMQLGILQMTIKTMEMQKASLEALRAQAQAQAASASAGASSGGSSSSSSGGKGKK